MTNASAHYGANLSPRYSQSRDRPNGVDNDQCQCNLLSQTLVSIQPLAALVTSTQSRGDEEQKKYLSR